MTLKKLALNCLSLVAVLLLLVPAGLAQTNYGALRGEVKDVQGGVIKGAKITVTNQETKIVQTAVTNGSGIYILPAIDPGTYKVKIEFGGFKTYEEIGNVVTLGATTTVDVALAVGASNELVEVTADTVTLNTASATGEQVFTAQQVQDLPNLGRDPFMFAQFDANVVTLGDPRYVRSEDSSGISDVSLAGAPGNTNSYVVDGVPVSTSSGGATFVVPPDAVSEAKVQADTFDAEIARTGGGVFNNTLKVGSTSYHGVLYGETRQTAWSANAWYNQAHTPTPTDETYLYAGAFGGPLVPPDLKNKTPHWLDNTFYWIDEEGYRQAQPDPGTASYYVPTIAEQSGDFTADMALYDPTQAVVGTTRTVTFGSECNGYNVIPGSPAATKYGTSCGGLNLYNGVGSQIAHDFNQPINNNIYSQTNQYNFTVSGLGFKTRDDTYVGKLEHQFFPWWTAQISYLHSAVQEPQATPGNQTNLYTSGNDTEDRKFDATALNNTFTINSSTLLTVSYGFNRYFSAFPYKTEGFNESNFLGSGYGFSSAFTSNVPLPSFPLIALSGISNGYSSPSLGGAYGGPTPQASHNFVTVLSKTVKKHNFRFGYTYRGFSYFTNPPSTPGSFTFNGQYTDTTGNATPATQGYTTIADLELGLPSALTETLYKGPYINRIANNGVFIQDDFRLTPKITFNAGVRYEYEQGQHEENNKFNVGFSPTAPITYTNFSGGTENLAGGLVFAGVNGAPTHCCHNGNTKFMPRIGVAYQVLKNTVVHAGYGMFYAPVGITTSYNQGYAQSTTPSITSPGANTGTITAVPLSATGNNACLSNPFNGGTCPGGLLQPSGNTLGALTGLGGNLTGFDTGRQYPLVQQYMMDVQQKLPGDFIVTVSYVGSHSNHFPLPVNINQLPNSYLASAYASNTKLTTNSLAAGAINPYYAATIGGLPTTGVVANKTSLAVGQTELPFPYYGSIILAKSLGYAWYNSVAVKVEKRVTTGLTLLTTYTHAANWDNLYSGIGTQIFSTAGPQDYTNLGAEYGRSLDSIPNRYTLLVTDVLPFGKGKKYMGHPSGFVGKTADAIVGGWEVNYEQIMANGVPLSVTQTNMNTQFGPTGTGGSVQRPTLVGDVHAACYSGSPQTRLGVSGLGVTEKYYVNSAAFTPTQAYHYGNAPRTLPCRAPGYNSATASLAKYIVNFKGFKVQYRVEALNLWNTPQFGQPTTTYGVTAPTTPTGLAVVSPTNSLGSVQSQIGFGRILQMGARLTF